ncbi:MAG TPA: HIT family protein [Rhizomicrobium sp.]|nr:HIT family protein [Rhizomicrobium sp.]
MSGFVLHPRLEADTEFIADFALSRVLAMNDARYPWLILVPRRERLTEIHELAASDRETLMEEIARAGAALKTYSNAAKINVGALGNLVPQLHIHIVGRNPGDAAWPGPVWGQGTPVPYEPKALKAFVKDVGMAIAP